MSTTYYSKAKIFFTAAARAIAALQSFISTHAHGWSNSIFSHWGVIVTGNTDDELQR